MAWIGFAAGVCLLLLTGSSVIKTLLIPRNLSSLIGTFVARSVLFAFRLMTVRIENLYRRERILSAGAPTFLFALLVGWLCSLYLGFALMLLPFTRDDMPNAFRLSGSSLFTLGFATPAGAAPYGIVFAAAISGLGVIALIIGYMPTIYSAYNRREILVIMLEALAGKPPWGPEVLARQQLIGNVEYLGRVYERWTEWAADISESHTTYRTLIYFRSRYAENAWPLALLAVLDAAALHLALCPDSAPAEARPLLRVGYMALRQIGRTLRVPVNDDPHPDDPLRLTREDFDEAVKHMDAAGWVFERKPDEAWPHFRGWRVNYELAAEGIAAHLDLPQAKWSGPRARLGQARMPDRPAHREPKAAAQPADTRPQPGDRPLQGAPGVSGGG
ncbi:MAG TPA: hypothetical protein VFB06_18390 [Streptosporangiaceae bacterium]|nr:hypothetical protein [Streptosporangiaceae bacterium]